MTSVKNRNLFELERTPAIFMSSYPGITAPQQPTVRAIINALKSQEELYAQIFELVKDYITKKEDIDNYLQIEEIVQRKRTGEVIPRGSIDLDHKFVFFVASNPAFASKLQNMSTVLSAYLEQIKLLNSKLEKCKTILEGITDENNAAQLIEEVGDYLRNNITMEGISAVTCNPIGNTMSEDEVQEYFANTFKNDNSNYSKIIVEQVLGLLKRISYISN
jgi:hypothetical protein